MQDIIDEIKTVVETLETEVTAYEATPNKPVYKSYSAVRKGAQQLKTLAQKLRVEISETQKAKVKK